MTHPLHGRVRVDMPQPLRHVLINFVVFILELPVQLLLLGYVPDFIGQVPPVLPDENDNPKHPAIAAGNVKPLDYRPGCTTN